MNPVPPDPRYSGYYRPDLPGQGGRSPGVYFDVIGQAWKTILADPSTWIAVSLITVLLTLPLGFYSTYLSNGGSLLPPENAPFDLAAWGMGELVSILAGTVYFILLCGTTHMGVKTAYGEPVSVGDLFVGFRRVFSVSGAYLITGFAMLIGFMLCLVPGIYVMGAMAFTAPLLIERNLGAFQAVGDSFDALKPHAWSMFALLFVAGLASGVGVLLCGVGLLVTLPIYGIVIGIHYTYFFPRVAPSVPGYGFLAPPPSE